MLKISGEEATWLHSPQAWGPTLCPYILHVWSCRVFSSFLTVTIIPFIPGRARLSSLQGWWVILCESIYAVWYDSLPLAVEDLLCYSTFLVFNPVLHFTSSPCSWHLVIYQVKAKEHGATWKVSSKMQLLAKVLLSCQERAHGLSSKTSGKWL